MAVQGVSKETVVRSRTVSLRDIHVTKVTSNTEADYTAEKPVRSLQKLLMNGNQRRSTATMQ